MSGSATVHSFLSPGSQHLTNSNVIAGPVQDQALPKICDKYYNQIVMMPDVNLGASSLALSSWSVS